MVRREASARRMVTPRQELLQKRKAERRKRGWPGLDGDALEGIGAVMAKNLRLSDGKQQLLIDSAGAESQGSLEEKSTGA